MQKLASQFDLNKNPNGSPNATATDAPVTEIEISDEVGTVLHLLDTYNKTLFDLDTRPLRKTREEIDGLIRAVVENSPLKTDAYLFRIRQFFSSYRIEESAYVQKSFDEFRSIIWSLVDQLSDDFDSDKKEDLEVRGCLDQLREAVESNSVTEIKATSLEFINKYNQVQAAREKRQSKRTESIKKNLDSVKAQLVDVATSAVTDHLTGALNRKAFDENLRKTRTVSQLSNEPVCLLLMDIDHFKRVNDTYGHDVGDFVIQECVRVLKETFSRPEDSVARVGGEEFGVILPGLNLDQVVPKAEAALERFRQETYVKDEMKLNFTVSMGLSQWMSDETVGIWYKRTDQALYASKHNGRNRLTMAPRQLIRTVA